jgi:hypothetical protein
VNNEYEDTGCRHNSDGSFFVPKLYLKLNTETSRNAGLFKKFRVPFSHGLPFP